ncbi:MAG: LysM peptidoglycan-binding domain-containing protein [Bacillota bacterium]|nr:LysM peptidoglycan-binding domain-containing protein [Bacillota bacterium]
MKKKYVLKNKKRFCTFIIILTVLAITVFTAGISYGYKDTPNQKVVVSSGDTLWGIAEKYNQGSDIRETVYEIKKLNKLESSDIYIGQKLIVPAG